MLKADKPRRKPQFQRIVSALRTPESAGAEARLREYLDRFPGDPDALFVASRFAARQGRRDEAASLLIRCLELAPEFALARYEHAKLLMSLHNYVAAIVQIDCLLNSDPDNPLFLQLKAASLDAVGEEGRSLTTRQRLADENPGNADCWIRLGDAHRAMGHRDNCIVAYRRAIACRPASGPAWWSLANMKTLRFSDDDISAMRALLESASLDSEDRIDLLFALGRAYETAGNFPRSFEQYAKGNAARRLRTDYNWNDIDSELATQKRLYTIDFLGSRRGAGCMAPDPIFVLGRPRSGSTLVEQILSSHSHIEGTAELPHIADCVWQLLDGACVTRGIGYPQIVAELPPAALAEMGETYIGRSRIHRKLARPFFIDKAPANYHHVGLILLALPNAKIIDARRNPAACCFSMFTHNYKDTNLRLDELGRVYRNYVELMAHFDHVAPGRIHRVIHENVIADPKAEIVRLLDYLQLPFEENCLRFHETQRAVRTPSSEQVRRPISGEGVTHWRNFEPWLRPLVDSLGSVLAEYPQVPAELR